MYEWSGTPFLQAIGWAIVNSFWQMALLWCLFSLANQAFTFSSHRKYILSALAIITGFTWFIYNFIHFYINGAGKLMTLFDQSFKTSNSTLNIILSSASIAYLALLAFPTYRLFKNWIFVKTIKKKGLKKANFDYRQFVQRIATQLDIKRKVFVYLSQIVSSPVTVGYLKPIILIPVAAMNNLTPQQVEAVLLHELSHIKRCDYLINLIISIIHTLLYFNPFIKGFIKHIEAEREHCCDDLVLQFGYDKLSYASALLTLEKVAAEPKILAIGATGKRYLLNRIEKIVGMNKKNGLTRRSYAMLIAGFICIVVFNSILILKEEKTENYSFSYTQFANPFTFFESNIGENSIDVAKPEAINNDTYIVKENKSNQKNADLPQEASETHLIWQVEAAPPAEEPAIIPVTFDEVDGSLTKEQKDQVNSTVAATKKVLSTIKWQEVETQMADAMTIKEKEAARQEYLQELESVNWQNFENKLKVDYENVDWTKINSNLAEALTMIHLDSIQRNYSQIMTYLDKTINEIDVKSKVSCSPLPDASYNDIRKAKMELQKQVEKIKAVRSKKVIKL